MILGVASGCFALTAMGSMAFHFHKLASRFESAVGGKIFIRERSGFFGAGAIDQNELFNLKKEPGVADVVPLTVARLQVHQIFVIGFPQIAIGIPLEKISLLLKDVSFLSGRFPETPDECMLGINIAMQEGLHPDFFTFEGKKFRVAGILARTNGPEDEEMIVPLSSMQEILGRHRLVSFGLVIPENESKADALADRLSKKYEKWQVIPPSLLAREIKRSSGLWNFLTIGTALLSAFVCGILILVVMMMAVQERIKEIGILTVIGASRIQIFTGFILESLFLSLIGSGLGLAVGFLTIAGANQFLARQGMVLFEPNGSLVLFAFLSSVGLSLFGGFYPALYGSGLPPAEALRR